MDEADFSEKIADIVSSIRPYIPLVLFIVVVAAGIMAYYYLFPRPGSLTVNISGLDGNTVDSVVNVYITDMNGNPVGGPAGSVIAIGGQAYFPSLPSNSQLELNVDAGRGYNPYSQPFQLESGAGTSEDVQLERANHLVFTDNDVPTLMPQGCQDTFYVDLTNNGQVPFDAQLLAEGDPTFATYFNFSTPVQIPPNQTQRVYFTLNMPTGTGGNSGSGASQTEDMDVRVKGTKAQLSLPITITSPIQATLSPQSISIGDYNPSITQMTLSNTGQAPLQDFGFSFYPDPGLSTVCGSDGSQCFSIDMLSNKDLTTLQPGQQITFELDNKGIPSGLTPVTNGYNAALVLTAACLHMPGITTNINVNPQASG